MNNEKLLKIINHFGLEHQIKKLLEECMELQTAIVKDTILKDRGLTRIVDEIADVSVVIDQLSLVLPQIKESKEFKINRTLEKIKDKDYV